MADAAFPPIEGSVDVATARHAHVQVDTLVLAAVLVGALRMLHRSGRRRVRPVAVEPGVTTRVRSS